MGFNSGFKGLTAFPTDHCYVSFNFLQRCWRFKSSGIWRCVDWQIVTDGQRILLPPSAG